MRLTLVLRAVAVALVCLAPAAAAHAEPRIIWRVENPFRLFNDPADTEVHRATYEALTDEQRKTPVLSAERALAERHKHVGWAATMYDHTCWSAALGRYVCKRKPDYLTPRSHQILAHLVDVPDAGAVDCTWLTAPLKRGGRGGAVTGRCSDAVRLEIPFAAGARVSVEVGGREVASATVRVRDLLIVGMGDSFASGEGNPDVPVRFSRERTADYGRGSNGVSLDGYPARVGNWTAIGDTAFIDANPRWNDLACHRSLYSHQLRAALQLAIEDPHRAVTFVGYSCSGAEIVEGLFLRYKGHEWVPRPPPVSQISAAAVAQCGDRRAPAYDLPEAYSIEGKVPDLEGGLVLRKCDQDYARKIDLVLVSIGGNDIGFSRLVANAVLADRSLLRRLGGWFGQLHGFDKASSGLDQLEYRFKALNRALHVILHVPWDQSDRVLLTSYPNLALLPDGRTICPDTRAGMTVLPDFALSEVKARESMAVAERLEAVMSDSSRQHGWTFVDAHRKQFLGRGICAGFSEHSFSIADDLRLPRKIKGRWYPFNPADWDPYEPRQRWFRTPNDAFLTGNFHVSQSLLQKALNLQSLSWFQLLLASTYSGAFHPTAEGQAAIADAVVVAARRVLAKYAGPAD